MLAVHAVYSLFAHGVDSAAMANMFLFPLLGGCVFFLILALLLPDLPAKPRYRLFTNLYNAGIATLTLHGFLVGVLEIAGTASAYTAPLEAVGWCLAAAGLLCLATLPFSPNRKPKAAA